MPGKRITHFTHHSISSQCTNQNTRQHISLHQINLLFSYSSSSSSSSMMAGKLPSSLPSLIPCGSGKTSLLSLATLTLIFVTYISFKSLHFPLQNTSSVSDLSPFPPIFQVAVTTTKKPDLEELSDIYHSSEVFRLNYVEMEENFNFKVYIYPNGDPNTFYQTPRKLTGKYASEGYFFQNTRGPKIQILLTSYSSPFPVTKCVERVFASIVFCTWKDFTSAFEAFDDDLILFTSECTPHST